MMRTRLGLRRALLFRRVSQEARRRPWWWLWAALLTAALAMTVWAAIDDRWPADVAVARWIQAHDPGGQPLIDFVRDVGSTVAALVTVVVLAGALAASGRRRPAGVVLALALAFALQGGLKEIVGRPRPTPDLIELRAGFDSLSFPSGHAMSSVIAGGLTLYLAGRLPLRWWLRLPAAVWGLGVMVLNPWVAVSSGVHWPSDALGGVLWAVVALFPAIWALERTSITKAGGRNVLQRAPRASGAGRNGVRRGGRSRWRRAGGSRRSGAGGR